MALSRKRPKPVMSTINRSVTPNTRDPGVMIVDGVKNRVKIAEPSRSERAFSARMSGLKAASTWTPKSARAKSNMAKSEKALSRSRQLSSGLNTRNPKMDAAMSRVTNAKPSSMQATALPRPAWARRRKTRRAR